MQNVEKIENPVTVAQPSFMQRMKTKAALAVGAVTAMAISASAHANDAIDTAGLTAGIGSGKTAILALFAAGLVILGIFVAYRYLKKGANTA